LAVIGCGAIAITLGYVRTMFGFAYGLAAGVALLAAARWLSNRTADMLLRILGTVSGLYAVWDIASDALFRSVPVSDANALAALTGVPGVVWALLWIAVSIIVLGLVLRLTVVR